MRLATKIRIGFVLSLVILGIVVVVSEAPGWRQEPGTQVTAGPQEGERLVILKVTFTPASRPSGREVTIWAHIDRDLVVNNEPVHSAPWDRVKLLKRGQKLVLNARQSVDGSLTCALFDNLTGAQLIPAVTRSNRGTVTCSYVNPGK